MAYVICERHGGNVAAMASIQVCEAIYKEETILHKADLELLGFAILEDVKLYFWIFKSELEDIGPIVPEDSPESELEKNEYLMNLMQPCCSHCFNERVTG